MFISQCQVVKKKILWESILFSTQAMYCTSVEHFQMKPTNIAKQTKSENIASKNLKSAAIISLRQTWLVSCYRRSIDHVELNVEAFLGCSAHSFTRWLIDWLISLVCSSSMIRSTLSRLHRSETPPVMPCREPKRWINTKTHFLFSTITHWLCIHTTNIYASV